MGTLQITVGDLHCSARWEEEAAPQTVAAIRRMLPIEPAPGWQDVLREIGRRCLWEGAQDIRIAEVE